MSAFHAPGTQCLKFRHWSNMRIVCPANRLASTWVKVLTDNKLIEKHLGDLGHELSFDKRETSAVGNAQCCPLSHGMLVSKFLLVSARPISP